MYYVCIVCMCMCVCVCVYACGCDTLPIDFAEIDLVYHPG